MEQQPFGAPREDPLTQAERHVREGAARVDRQSAIYDKLVRDGHETEAAQAKAILNTLKDTLDLAREHLRIEREQQGVGASRPGFAGAGS
ncbi:MAG TPA: hypothetical protein VD978_17705 [Azospirillum sp.]|nr:hypothetical protein [Azospirillum sp.]